ncbi:MAG TPA: hypothetical protein VFZ61_24565 [Polyangiales bacterium]
MQSGSHASGSRRALLGALCIGSCAAGAACAEPLSSQVERPPPALGTDAGDALDGTMLSTADVAADTGVAVDALPAPTDADLRQDAHDAPTMRTELVDHARWVRVDAAGDPFGDRPTSVLCESGATLAEAFGGVSAYGVDTASCNYVTLQQPTTRAIAAGEVVRVRLAHFELTAPEDAEAHVAVQIDGLRVLDERIPIPSPTQVLVRELLVPRTLAAGAATYFHVHNHGANSYALISLSAGSE